MALPPGASRDQEVQRIARLIESKIPGAQGQQLAQSYEAYAAAHPRLSAQSAYVGWFITTGKIGQKIGKDIGIAIGGGGQLAGDSVASLGVFHSGILSFLSNLSQRAFWVRVAKVIIGGAMVISGLAKLSGASGALSNIKVVPV